MNMAAVGGSRLRVILGTMDMGRRALAEDKAVREQLRLHCMSHYNTILSIVPQDIRQTSSSGHQ